MEWLSFILGVLIFCIGIFIGILIAKREAEIALDNLRKAEKSLRKIEAIRAQIADYRAYIESIWKLILEQKEK